MGYSIKDLMLLFTYYFVLTLLQLPMSWSIGLLHVLLATPTLVFQQHQIRGLQRAHHRSHGLETHILLHFSLLFNRTRHLEVSLGSACAACLVDQIFDI